MMKITFGGAADNVTGSCHYVELDGMNVLLDCGMFQGLPPVQARNKGAFPFDPRSVDWVILSHAHLDHTGRLPALVRQGFEGKVLATSATRDLGRLIMMDSARIQQADFERSKRKGIPPTGGYHSTVLYDLEDVHRTLQRFSGEAKYGETVELGKGVSVTFHDAGHVMGSGFIELSQTVNGSTKRLTFSGDLGNVDKPLVRDPFPRVAGADVLLLESTYGARNHRPFDASVAELREVITKVFERKGVVVIPAFALERSQELLYVLAEFHAEGGLGGAKVYLDSPMAIEVTNVFMRHPECLDIESIDLTRRGINPFGFEALNFTQSVHESKRINQDSGPAIVVSASGMCSGGRIVHHLRQRLKRDKHAVVFIGYQAEGTLGRKIVDGAKEVMIYGELVDVDAEVHTLGGFSGHAGADTLLEWLGSADLPSELVLVHGEKEAKEGLATAVQERFGLASRTVDHNESVTF